MNYVASVGNAKFESLQEAIAAAKDGDVITLLSDVEVTSTIINNGNVTIDLAGYDITMTIADVANGNALFINNGTLTITDSAEEDGEICLTYTGSRNGNVSISTIINYGILNVQGGTINCNSGAQYISYAIDSIANKNVEVNISGGTVKGGASGWCIRLFMNSTTNENVLNVTGGSVNYVWAQNPNADANKVTINVTGGYVAYVYIAGANGALCDVSNVTMNVNADCVYYAPYLGTNDSEYVILTVDGMYIIHKHAYSTVVTDPDCVNGGYTTYTCECGYTYVADETAALGHTAGDVVVENFVDSDCVNTGSYDNVTYCTVCGVETSRETITVPAKGHTASAAVTENFVDSDLNNTGSYDSVVYCSVCNTELSRETVIVPVKEGAVASINGFKYATLAEAIAAAQTNETVVLLSDVKLDETITIAKSITIDGNGYSLIPADSNKSYNSAIMAGDSGWGDDHGETITLKNLKFIGWNTNYGVVRAQGVTLIVEGCEFTGNSVSNYSYAVLSLNYTDASVIGSKFTNNTSRVIDINYNGDSSKAVVTIDGCEFVGNTTTGAGIVMRSAGTMALKNSIFENNTVNTNGNAATVYVGFGTGSSVIGCTFEGNTVITSHATTKRFGSAIFCDGTVVKDNVFGNNTAIRNGETITTVVAVGAYYGAADISGNYWGGNAPVPGVDYTIEYSNQTVEIKDYYADTETTELISLNYVAKVGKYSYTTLADAIAAANGAKITLLANIELSAPVVANIDLNGYTLKGTVVGTVYMNKGTWITAEGITMAAPSGAMYNTEDAVITMAANYDLTLVSGVVTLGADWRTLPNQKVIVAEAATVIIPEGKTFTILCDVVINGTLTNNGSVVLGEADATLTAVGGLTITTTAGDKVMYINGKYVVHFHTAGDVVVENFVDSDCVNTGSYDNVTYCTVCGDELSRETITVPAKGHTAGEIVVENFVDSDCVNTGSYDNVTYCTVCGAETSRETITVPAKGHTAGEVVVENSVAPDCTNTGSYDNVIYCSVCGTELSRETITVNALGHTYEAVVTAPTCTEDGYTTYTCACGESYVADKVAAPGHNYDAVVTDPTCAVNGYTTYTCSVCGSYYIFDEVPALGHVAGDPYELEGSRVEPTLNNRGSYIVITPCSVCGEEVSRETVYTAMLTGAVASVDDYKYATLAEAIANADGKTVKLLKNMKIAEAIVIESGNVTIDFNGYYYEVSSNATGAALVVKSGATVTLTNSKAYSDSCRLAVDYNYHTYFTCLILNQGTLNVSNFRLNGANLHNVGAAVINNSGSVYLGEGTVVTVNAKQKIAFISTNSDVTKAASVEVAPAAGYHWKNSTALEAHIGGSVVVENLKNPTLNDAGSYDNVVYCTVCGEEVSRETIYTPVKTGAAASVDGYKYATLAEAIANANGKVVTLLKNIRSSSAIVIESGYDITIDFNGFYYEVSVHAERAALVIKSGATVTLTSSKAYNDACRLALNYDQWTDFTCLIKNAGTLNATNIRLNGANLNNVGAPVINNTGVVNLGEGTVVTVNRNQNIALVTSNSSITKAASVEVAPAAGYHWIDNTVLEAHIAGSVVIENEVAATLNNKGSYDQVTYCAVCGEELSRKTVSTAMLTGAVASVDGYKYATLEEAIANANGKTVKLLKNVRYAKAIVIESGNVTIDLNGYWYEVSQHAEGAALVIRKGATVTLTSSKGYSASCRLALDYDYYTDFNCLVKNAGTLNVSNIRLNGANLNKAGSAVINNIGTVNLGENAVITVNVYQQIAYVGNKPNGMAA